MTSSSAVTGHNRPLQSCLGHTGFTSDDGNSISVQSIFHQPCWQVNIAQILAASGVRGGGVCAAGGGGVEGEKRVLPVS